MNKMQWLRDYERSRHSKQPNESWVSSKYDTQLPWKELQQTYIPSLHMNWGQCCSALKRSWKAYEIAGRLGEPRGDIAWRIRNIQTQMGIEISDFPELEAIRNNASTRERGCSLRREEILLIKKPSSLGIILTNTCHSNPRPMNTWSKIPNLGSEIYFIRDSPAIL